MATENRKLVPVTLYLEPEQIEWATKKAREQDRPVARVYRDCIDYARGVVKIQLGGKPLTVKAKRKAAAR